jgi:hypothetical protein
MIDPNLKNSDAPAFPTGRAVHEIHGLTKREYFAGLAMQALSSNEGIFRWTSEEIASKAMTLADELLKKFDQ